MTNSSTSVQFLPELEAATGKLAYPMTNDYMFRAVLQSNNKALTGLIGSLLHIPIGEISSVVVTNPIILGESYKDKEFRLDINVILNDKRLINLEMQVLKDENWTIRSLSYLCRNFDNLTSGDDYSKIMPVVHIGILDFTLFKNAPEFYSKYMFMNTRTHKIYSDKLALHVLNLKHGKLATKEDKRWGIDYWAELFKATTWEELKMIAQSNEYMAEASNSIFRMNADEIIRKRCRDREDYYRDIRGWKKQIEEQGAKITEQGVQIKEQNTKLKEQGAQIEEMETALEEKDAALEEKDAALEEKDAMIADKDAALQEKDAEIACLRKQLENSDR
ncbi:MAG: Rpn family recombination-promoting nuclease/putative transposase [Butyrivibrio sp.]|nr:Rpn family recombination-promoting nuclease/putative transposase [Muribaculum sp.]MCM1553433.1 Rpn family recombination-promoting nuclease/putative transposase [Butyrivibrio sp.]